MVGNETFESDERNLYRCELKLSNFLKSDKYKIEIEELMTSESSSLYLFPNGQDIYFRISLYLEGIPDGAYACFLVNDYVISDVGLTKRDEISSHIQQKSVVWNYVRIVEYTEYASVWSLFNIWEWYKSFDYIMTNEDDLV